MGASAAPSILISAVLLLSISTASAFNITILLGRYPGFETFNDLLSRTSLAAEINHRRTITILALTNDRMGPITGKPEDVQRKILSDHVILDYFDSSKLNKLKVDNRTVLTTLFQASGSAQDRQGFLVAVHQKDGSIVFGSAVKGSPVDARLESFVASQPYNISVLSISQPIIAPGIDGVWSPLPESAPAKAPAPPKAASPPPAESPVVEEPQPEPADAPALAPAGAPAPGPAAEAAADADDSTSPPPKSAAGKQLASSLSFGLVVALASFLAT